MNSPNERFAFDAAAWVPEKVGTISNHQIDLPRIAKDERLTAEIEARLAEIPSRHDLFNRDARELSFLSDQSVHLVVTSPPYWTLKEYRESPGQLGHVKAYEDFLDQLDEVWKGCFRALVPGGRLVCVVGDVCLSRRKNHGEHTVVPLHASIQERCRKIGYSNLAPIIWHKIANAVYEASGNGGGFLGKPFEPNSVIKNDIEYILMERKPGGYRSPDIPTRILSVIPSTKHKLWFQQIWTGITGASTRLHPAPFPLELADRLIRMFSFVGDVVLDPFMGTGTTSVAAARAGRSSIGVEIDPHYFLVRGKSDRKRHETLVLPIDDYYARIVNLDIEAMLRNAVTHFWRTRATQQVKQASGQGPKDAGRRSAVTGGKHADGFVRLVAEIVAAAGLPEASVHAAQKRGRTLPGYFRPTKEWDLVVTMEASLIAAIEFKSQVGSFGNNFNNRVEEALGNATDFWGAYEHGTYAPTARPWLGYIFMLEEHPTSLRPTKEIRLAPYDVDQEFQGRSYAQRYELVCLRLLRERLYDAACFLTSNASDGIMGRFSQPNEELSIRNFAASLYARAVAFAHLKR